MEQSDRVEGRLRHEAEASLGRAPGRLTMNEARDIVRPLVERIAEQETRVDACRGALESSEMSLTAARDELVVERQARRTADELASRQTDRINALERLSAEHVARVYELQAEVDRQAEIGAEYLERAERAEEAHRMALGEAADERALKARYGVALEQAETKRRAAEALVERLRGAMRGMAVEWARDIVKDERRVCGGGQS